MTRDEFLDGLTWHDGPPPIVRVGLIYELKIGKRIIVGDINDDGGVCGCCPWNPDRDEVARWAELFEATR